MDNLMKPVRMAFLLVLLLFGGCAGRYTAGYESPAEESPGHEGSEVSRLHIPPGHLPAPGTCRIWLPGVPPGQQPPPGECSHLETAVPRGAWLLSRPEEKPEYVEVIIYDEEQPGIVFEIAMYVAANGKFVGKKTPR